MTTLQVFKLSLSHALVLEPDDVGKLTFYAIYLFLIKGVKTNPRSLPIPQIGSFERSNLQYKYEVRKTALPRV